MLLFGRRLRRALSRVPGRVYHLNIAPSRCGRASLMKTAVVTAAPIVAVAACLRWSAASDSYWDADTVAAGNSASTGSNLGGTGTWDVATTNWWDGSNPAADQT